MTQYTQLWVHLSFVSLELFSCFAALILRQVPEERGSLDRSIQAGLMCLDKALHMADMAAGKSVC